jgi:hypothetical protein
VVISDIVDHRRNSSARYRSHPLLSRRVLCVSYALFAYMMSLTPSSSAAAASMQAASFEQNMMDNAGNLRISSELRFDEVTKHEQKLMSSHAANPLSIPSLLRCADHSAKVTAAALRSVGALRSLPGANVLRQRNKLEANQKLVPGYAKLTTVGDFEDDVKLCLSDGLKHPVEHEKAWACKHELTPIFANFPLFRTCHLQWELISTGQEHLQWERLVSEITVPVQSFHFTPGFCCNIVVVFTRTGL